MIKNFINQSSLPYINFQFNKRDYNVSEKVKKGLTLSQFGYAIMARSSGSYQVSFHVWEENESKLKPLEYLVSIPRGPRRIEESKSPSRAAHKKCKQLLNILLLSGMLVLCWISIWKWSLVRKKRLTYAPIYELEPLHA
jgi:hypothetical protein